METWRLVSKKPVHSKGVNGPLVEEEVEEGSEPATDMAEGRERCVVFVS
jgi:hypothetical protein